MEEEQCYENCMYAMQSDKGERFLLEEHFCSNPDIIKAGIYRVVNFSEVQKDFFGIDIDKAAAIFEKRHFHQNPEELEKILNITAGYFGIRRLLSDIKKDSELYIDEYEILTRGLAACKHCACYKDKRKE